MFKRIIVEDWVTWMPYVAFTLTFAVFISIVIKAVLMNEEKREHLANLPLEAETKTRDH